MAVADDLQRFGNLDLLRLGSANPYKRSVSNSNNDSKTILPKVSTTSSLLTSRSTNRKKNSEYIHAITHKKESEIEKSKSPRMLKKLLDVPNRPKQIKRKNSIKLLNLRTDRFCNGTDDKLNISGMRIYAEKDQVQSGSTKSSHIKEKSFSPARNDAKPLHRTSASNTVTQATTALLKQDANSLSKQDNHRENITIKDYLKIENERYEIDERIVKRLLFHRWLNTLGNYVGYFQTIGIDTIDTVTEASTTNS